MTGILNEFGARWAAYFAAALVQNTVFVALVLVVLHRLRRMSAHIRYAVGVVAVAKLLLPPFVPARLGIGIAETLQTAEGFTGTIFFVPSGGGGPAAAQPGAALSVAGLLFTVWIATVTVYLLATTISTLRLALSLRRAVPVTGETAVQLTGCKRIRVYRSDRIAMPLTLGIFPRTIFVPAAWDGWTEECRRMILRHETAHIARRDGLVQVLQIIARALYFFHSFVHLLDRRIAEYREMACDDESAGTGRNAGVEYSRFLVEIAESIIRTPATCQSASALMKKKNEMLNRVRYQMKGAAMMSRGKTAVVLAALVLLVLPLSWYYSSATPETGAGPNLSEKAPQATIEEAYPGTQQEVPRPPETAPVVPPPPKESTLSYVTIAMPDESNVTIDGEKASWDLVKQRLQALFDIDPKRIVKLKCEGAAPMRDIHRIHRLLREIGLDKIEYIDGNGYGSPLVLPPRDIEERISRINAVAIADLRIDAGGTVSIDGETVEMSKLSGIVAKRLEKVPPLIVTVQTETQTKYADFLSVLSELKKAEAHRIVIKEPAGP